MIAMTCVGCYTLNWQPKTQSDTSQKGNVLTKVEGWWVCQDALLALVRQSIEIVICVSHPNGCWTSVCGLVFEVHIVTSMFHMSRRPRAKPRRHDCPHCAEQPTTHGRPICPHKFNKKAPCDARSLHHQKSSTN